MSSHRDETGAPCSRHRPVSQDVIMMYAAIGSRMSSFHHDVASKLQSLMMAVDEITELGNDDVRTAAATAAIALQEINQMLSINRALTKTPQRKATSLREIVARAAERHGVKLRGDVPDIQVQAALASMVHALDLLIDMLAGPSRGERAVAIEVADGMRITLTATTAFEAINEHVELAAFLLAREAATLTCRANGFVVELAQ